MMINFEADVEFDKDFDFDAPVLAGEVLETVLRGEKCPIEAEAELLLTDIDSMKEINNEYRNVDAPTDVLSFPNIEWSSPSYYDDIDFEGELLLDPDTGYLMLGQIILCKERILSQAEEFGHSVKREYAFLITHSVLHLLGYDHMEDDERTIMEEKQREYMEILGIPR